MPLTSRRRINVYTLHSSNKAAERCASVTDLPRDWLCSRGRGDPVLPGGQLRHGPPGQEEDLRPRADSGRDRLHADDRSPFCMY